VNGVSPALDAVLLDIEGTTTPIAFVTEVLVPYARRHLASYLAAHAGEAEHDALLDRLRAEHASAREDVPPWPDSPVDGGRAAVAAYVGWLTDRDRKSTAFKELQGRIWEDGYRSGSLVARVFPDVRPALERWRARGTTVGIFSSGSVLAQQLLFSHTNDGDLSPLVQHYFDTRVGSKTDPESYARIAGAMAVAPASCLFLSDVGRELEAARAAGMQTRLVVRPGNAPTSEPRSVEPIQSLDEIDTYRTRS
jgi:enolase-phosphatase E1